MTRIVDTYFTKDEYKLIVESVPICTVDLVLFDQDFTEILLFKRKNKPLKDQYFTPGGRLYKNETLEDCAIRQAKQELGLNILKSDLILSGFINEIFEDSSFEDTNYHTLNSFFTYILKPSDQLKLDSQHDEYRFFGINDPNLHPYIKHRINSCLNFRNSLQLA